MNTRTDFHTLVLILIATLLPASQVQFIKLFAEIFCTKGTINQGKIKHLFIEITIGLVTLVTSNFSVQ